MRISRVLATFAAILATFPVSAATIETQAQYAYMVDYDTGTVMLNKGGEVSMHPSSMTKLMTSYILDRKLKEGKLKLTDAFTVSEKAWRMQGSKMFVHVGDQVPLEDLLRGIIIQSGNDACITVAEGVSGSEEAFAAEMNKVAKEIGLSGSHFVNSTGWPDEAHVMTARDLATLAKRIITDFPETYHYYSEQVFTYNNITQHNRNRLIGNDIGVDGLKTGHTDVAGYGITLSAKDPKSGRRLILVINGLPSDNARMEEGDRLLRWGLQNFTNRTIVKAGDIVDAADVWFGDADMVALTSDQDVTVTLPSGSVNEVKFALRYNGPLQAPVAKGTQVASLIVSIPGTDPQVIPLVAASDVAKVGGFSKIWRTLKALVTSSQRPAPAPVAAAPAAPVAAPVAAQPTTQAPAAAPAQAPQE